MKAKTICAVCGKAGQGRVLPWMGKKVLVICASCLKAGWTPARVKKELERTPGEAAVSGECQGGGGRG